MSIRSLLSIAVFLLAFVVNPAYFAGCGGISSGSEPEFGEAEMVALLDAANEQGRWEFESAGRRYELELSLMQAQGDDEVSRAQPSPLSGATAHACGNRRFMQSAAACVTVSELVVTGELTLRELSPEPRVVVSAVAVDGTMWTDAHQLVFATLHLQFGESNVALHSADAQRFELESVYAVDLEGETAPLEYEAPEGD